MIRVARTCKQCGEGFSPNIEGANTLECQIPQRCEPCRLSPIRGQIRICKTCGNEFRFGFGESSNKYCSSECFATRLKRSCNECGSPCRGRRCKACKAVAEERKKANKANEDWNKHRAGEFAGKMLVHKVASGWLAEQAFDWVCIARDLWTFKAVAENTPSVDRIMLNPDGTCSRVQVKSCLQGTIFLSHKRDFDLVALVDYRAMRVKLVSKEEIERRLDGTPFISNAWGMDGIEMMHPTAGGSNCSEAFAD